MSSIRIHLSDHERSCVIDSEQAMAWSRSLLEQILFDAARNASAAPPGTPVATTVTFRLTSDPNDGSLVIDS